jgi:5'-3' exonuclease
LLGDYIEASTAVQPDKVKLILKLRALKAALEKAETELESSHYTFRYFKDKYDVAMEDLKTLKHLAQLPIDQLRISFDELNNPGIAWVSEKNSKNIFQNLSFAHKGLKEPAQFHATLMEKLKDAESAEYQNKLEKLRQEIALPESIYKAFKQSYDDIIRQIQEVERLIVKEK